MIKSLELNNFQSHKNSTLEFDPGVNIIIGPSDSGKTAIIRALRWLVWNRPSGDAIRSTWGGETSASIQIDEQTIERIKDKVDEYKLGEIEFKAFGTNVPEEIIQALNLNEINLQQQLDSPFLLSSSPGEVAKHFNKIAHLDQIDSGLTNVQKWIREIEQDISSGGKQLEHLKEDLGKFVYLDKFEIDVEVLERMEKQMIQKVNETRVLNGLCLNLNKVLELIKEQEENTKAGPLVDSLLGLYEDLEINEDSQDALKGLMNEIEEAEEDLEEENKILGSGKLVDSLIGLFQEQTEKQNKCLVLSKLTKTIIYTTEEQKDAESSSKRLQTEFNAVFPNVCPLCGKPK